MRSSRSPPATQAKLLGLSANEAFGKNVMQWVLNRGANRPPKMEKHFSLTSLTALQQSVLTLTLKLVIDLMSSTAHPSTFAIDTQQLVKLNRNGHSKSSADESSSKGASKGPSAFASDADATVVVSKNAKRT